MIVAGMILVAVFSYSAGYCKALSKLAATLHIPRSTLLAIVREQGTMVRVSERTAGESEWRERYRSPDWK